jgi:hypothetical protein
VTVSQVVRQRDQVSVRENIRVLVTDRRIISQCRSVRITDMILTEFTHVTEISCTTALLHISGQDTTTVMDTEYAFFLHMFTDMYTME